MKCKRLGRIRFTEELLEDLGSNRELLGAFAKAMAPFIVISCTYDKVHEVFEQTFIDPLGIQLEEVVEGAVIPEFNVIITKMKVVDLYTAPYHCHLTPKRSSTTNIAGPM